MRSRQRGHAHPLTQAAWSARNAACRIALPKSSRSKSAGTNVSDAGTPMLASASSCCFQRCVQGGRLLSAYEREAKRAMKQPGSPG